MIEKLFFHTSIYMFRLFSKFCLSIWGWRVVGKFPDLKKYIIIVAPHTSNWDFLLAVFVRSATRLRSNFLGKSALFKAPHGWFFKALGGHAVDRSKSTKLVDKVVEIYNSKERFCIAVTPEGTRKKVQEWKTGFYFIAHGANIPIVMASLDYSRKIVEIAAPFYTTGDIEKDMPLIKAFYEGKKGKAEF